MPTVHVSDITMYDEVWDAGPPLVLIPGLASDVSEWHQSVGPLAERFTVVALDNRDSGRTDKPDAPYSIEQMADDAAGLLRAAGVGRETILGVSMGGRIALALALRYPDRVSRLVLVSTAASGVGRRRRMGLLGPISALLALRGKYPQPRYAFRRQREASVAFSCVDRLPRSTSRPRSCTAGATGPSRTGWPRRCTPASRARG